MTKHPPMPGPPAISGTAGTRLWNGDLTQATLLVADQFRAHAGNAAVGDPDAIRTRDDLVDWVRQTRTAIPGLTFHTAGSPAGGDGLVAARWYATFRSDDGTTKARLGVDVLTIVDGHVVAVWTVSGSRALDQAAPLRPLPDRVTDLDHFRVRRHDCAGGVIHEYRLVA